MLDFESLPFWILAETWIKLQGRPYDSLPVHPRREQKEMRTPATMTHLVLEIGIGAEVAQ